MAIERIDNATQYPLSTRPPCRYVQARAGLGAVQLPLVGQVDTKWILIAVAAVAVYLLLSRRRRRRARARRVIRRVTEY